jgi:hypothetical protein
MPIDYVPTPAFSTPKKVTADGELALASSVRIVQEQMHNDIAALKAGVHEETIIRHFGLEDMLFESAVWDIDHVKGCVKQIDHTASNPYVYIPLHLPNLSIVTLVTAKVSPTGHSALPTVKPRIELCRQLMSPFVDEWESRDSMSDDTLLADFDEPHEFTLEVNNDPTVLGLIQRASYSYRLRFTGEGGPDAENNLRFFGVSVAFVTSARDPGAG